MKTCNGCHHAKWDKTISGKLHPSGDGRCAFPFKIPPPPAAFYYIGKCAPVPCGGWINRKQENKDHCPYWKQMEE